MKLKKALKIDSTRRQISVVEIYGFDDITKILGGEPEKVEDLPGGNCLYVNKSGFLEAEYTNFIGVYYPQNLGSNKEGYVIYCGSGVIAFEVEPGEFDHTTYRVEDAQQRYSFLTLNDVVDICADDKLLKPDEATV